MLITDKSGNGVFQGRLISRASLTRNPLANAVPVTPSDSVDLPRGPARDLLITTAGTLSFVSASSPDVITTASLPIGRLGVAVRRVLATDTTAVVRALY